MSKFFVGQMARVKWVRFTHTSAWQPGAQVRIVEVGPFEYGRKVAGYYLHDRADCIVECSDGGLAGPFYAQLEPILPEGHKAGEYSLTELLDRCREGLYA